jgi:hypothetical protein
MTLDPFATSDDVVERLGRELSPSEAQRIDALLVDASGSIRARSRQIITRAVSTLRVRPIPDSRPRRQYRQDIFYSYENRDRRVGLVSLPQRPVNSITSVKWEGTDLAYRWDGLSIIEVGTLRPVDVVYDHGYDTTNDDLGVLDTIGGICCQIVGRALGRPADTVGLQQESIAGYSYTVGAAAAAGAAGMMQDEKDALDALFPRVRARTIRLPV